MARLKFNLIPGKPSLISMGFGGLCWLPVAMLGQSALLLGILFWTGWFMFTIRKLQQIPNVQSIIVNRTLPARFLIGRSAQIQLSIENRSQYPVILQFRDEIPDTFLLEEKFHTIRLKGNQKTTLTYLVSPTQRGRQAYGKFVGRITAPGGWFWRESQWDLAEDVKVYPDFKLIAAERLNARMLLKDWHVRRPRKKRGEGHEFESLRSYAIGDDSRHVDWKASARRQKLIVRQLQVERGQQIAIMLDCGRLMSESIAGHTRLDHSMNAALMLGQVAGKRGDNLSLVCFSNHIQAYMPSTKGRAVMHRMMETLYHVEASPLESDYWQVTAEAMHLLKRRSLIVFFTDVLDEAAAQGLANNLARAASRHLVLCVVLSEPGILAAASQMPTDSHEVYEKAAASQLLIKRHLALEKMRSKGILVLESTPNTLTIELVRRYIEIRMGNLQ
ncbi:DUF58 domain-containing protein [bacterium]|nr:DUF58 domain-containing protein [bacterium]MDB4663855.1 DUF58 domain-containing protein [Verrucomicrobiota bacterium]MDB4778961.1 DUF58 domain-containing protein [Verrucomicrobiota bacterium]